MTIYIAAEAPKVPLPVTNSPALSIKAIPGLLSWVTPSAQDVVKGAAGVVQGISSRAGSLPGLVRTSGTPLIVRPAGEKYDWLETIDRGTPSDGFSMGPLAFDPAVGMTFATVGLTSAAGPMLTLRDAGATENAMSIVYSTLSSVFIYSTSGSMNTGAGSGSIEKPYLRICRVKGDKGVINVGAAQSTEKALVIPACPNATLSVANEAIGGAKGWSGNLGELWLFNRWISDAEVQKLKDYVTAVYGASYV